MTQEQIAMAKAFSGVRFQVGSYDKRFCRDMQSLAVNKPETELTEAQAQLLAEKYHRYRRQIPHHKRLCEVCKAAARKNAIAGLAAPELPMLETEQG